MSGPFSLPHVQEILRGAVFCSPLLVSVQTQQLGMPDKLHVCQHLSKGDKNTPSMNSHIHKKRFSHPLRHCHRSLPRCWQHLFFFGLHGLHLWWHFFTGFTSGGPLLHLWWLVGFNSVGPDLYGLHLWWPIPHGFTSGGSLLELHLWWLNFKFQYLVIDAAA